MSRRGGIGIGMVAAVLLLLASCASKKKLVTPPSPAETYEWMTAKFNGEVTLNADRSPFNFTGSLRMRRDSTIWISATGFMGMEGIRALITQDSVIVINRLDQTYVAEPFEAMAATVRAPSLKECQALLLGNGTEPVVIQYGPYYATIRYSDIHWNEPTTFPIKINKRYERRKP